MGGKKLHLVGQTYGRLTVTHKVGYSKTAHTGLWGCNCSCGNTTVVSSSNLRTGHTKSCGCYEQECREKTDNKFTLHGHHRNNARSLTYQSWRCMRERCKYPSNASYKHYGAIGIKVCGRWDESLANFIEDMGERPGKEYSIDRINPFGNYEPGNCRWATMKEQHRNRRKHYGIKKSA